MREDLIKYPATTEIKRHHGGNLESFSIIGYTIADKHESVKILMNVVE